MAASDSIQAQIPECLVQGDDASFQVSIPDFSPNAGYIHKFTLIGQSAKFASVSGTQISIQDKVSIPVPVSITNTLIENPLTWQFRVTKDNRTALVLVGTVPITENLELAQNNDTRSNAQKILDKIDEALAGSSRITVLEYEIAGRQIKSIAHSELIELRKFYAGQVEIERRKSEPTKKRSGMIQTRFLRS